ncbi:MAG TPA: nucleotide sugar dehydrogenase [Planctomycetaceae bacterium]|nr:nucleotide sugar dehydrogenase [Planctomycetaceae bacterium]
MSAKIDLITAIREREATVGIVGLGYVGLPLIDAFLGTGFRLIGFDVDEKKVQELQSGKSYISHIPSTRVQQWHAEARFEATTNMSRLAEPDVILICVPTPLSASRDPDLKYVEATTRSIARVLRTGQLVVLESTTYPGTTRELMLPILERSGLTVDVDFFLAYSPEREDPGNRDFSASNIPKVVGGYGPNSREIADIVYSMAVAKTVLVSSVEAAEACKILENTYRSINIAMVNELKVLFDRIGVDIWEVIDAAKTKPFGFQAFYPGPGLGGHCIPIDPFYLSWVARKYEMPTKFIELAGEINTSMPLYVVHKVAEALNLQRKPVRGSKVGIFGVAYKKDVDDPRESPSFKLMELLADLGAVLSYSDPHIPSLPAMRNYDVPDLKSQVVTPEYLASLDCVLIATDHSAFDYEMIVEHAALVVDTRNATKRVAGQRANVVKA